MTDGSYRAEGARTLVSGWLTGLRRREQDGPAWRCRTWDDRRGHVELRDVLGTFRPERAAPRRAPAAPQVEGAAAGAFLRELGAP